MKTLWQLNLHETTTIGDYNEMAAHYGAATTPGIYHVTRVPGGWLYMSAYTGSKTATFVPFAKHPNQQK